MATIGNLRGFQALKPDVDLLKVKAKRKEKKMGTSKPPAGEEVPVVDDEEPTWEKDDSCVFTNGAEETGEKENEEVEEDDP